MKPQEEAEAGVPKPEAGIPKPEVGVPKPEPVEATPPLEEEDDDDPVVKEYTVYATSKLFNNLNVFQFPLRSANRSYNMSKLKSMRMQQQTKKFELKFDNSYDSMSSFSVQQDEESKSQPFILSSSRVRRKTNYAVGLLRGNSLHMTGLQHIHQFRPDLEESQNANPGRNTTTAAKTEEAEPKRPANDKFRLQESRMRSMYLKKLENIGWTDLTFIPQDAKTGEYEQLAWPSHNVIEFNKRQTTAVHLDVLFKIQKDVSTDRFTKIPLAVAHEYDWLHQANSLLLSARVIRFKTLYSMLRSKKGAPSLPSETDMITQLLDKSCVIINGLLVVKQVPDISGFEAFAREWVLLKLWEGKAIRRTSLMDEPFALPVGAQALKRILTDVGIMIPNDNPFERLWCLKCGGLDEEFISKFPEITREQDEEWTKRRELILTNSRTEFVRGKKLTLPFEYEPPTQQSSEDEGATNNKIARFIWKQFELHSVWNKEVLYAQFVKAGGAKFASNFKHVLEALTRSFEDGIILRNISRSKREPQEIDKYRPKYIQALLDKLSWQKREFDSVFKNVPKELHNQIINELCVISGSAITRKPAKV